MAHGICEGMWLKWLLRELKIPLETPMKMFCDNQAATSNAKNLVHHDRTHFIILIEEGTITLMYTPTGLQTTDILTKTLPRTSFKDFSFKLGTILQPRTRESVELWC